MYVRVLMVRFIVIARQETRHAYQNGIVGRYVWCEEAPKIGLFFGVDVSTTIRLHNQPKGDVLNLEIDVNGTA